MTWIYLLAGLLIGWGVSTLLEWLAYKRGFLRLAIVDAHRDIRRANRRARASVAAGELLDEFEGHGYWPTEPCRCPFACWDAGGEGNDGR